MQTKRAAPSYFIWRKNLLSIAWQRKCDGDKRKCHAKDEMPEDSDPFQDGTVLKEAFDRLNKYVVG